jgi:hypothetical protein
MKDSDVRKHPMPDCNLNIDHKLVDSNVPPVPADYETFGLIWHHVFDLAIFFCRNNEVYRRYTI